MNHINRAKRRAKPRTKRLFQIALFLAFSVVPMWAQGPFSFGAVVGIPLSKAMLRTDFPTRQTIDSGSREFVIGPSVELRLPLGFSVQADALFHPYDIRQTIYSSPSSVRGSTYKVIEFPVLAKYRLGGRILDPFIEGGYSYRSHLDAIQNISRHGLTAGIGIDVKLGVVRISPGVRYTRWGADTIRTGGLAAPSNQNQAAILVGISF